MTARDPRLAATAYVAERATVVGDVEVGARSSIWPGAVVRGDLAAIRIGEDSNVQDNAVVHADPGLPCTIGDRVTIGHAAVVHGCVVGDDCLIGIGALVLNGARLGNGSVVAAGALIPEGMAVPPGSVVVGIPGRVRGEVDDALRARAESGWRTYVELAERAGTGPTG
jgi:carbonic anhydrase/acetyltransferase-like protein (isoleucine patch superfamily)